MVSKKAKETLEKLDEGKYVNNRVLTLGGVPYSARDVLVKAPLIARLNPFYVGGAGRGKSELLANVSEFFGDSTCYMIGRPDFEPSELLREMRLDKLKEAKTDRELIAMTENVKKNFFAAEELNRAPEIVQNYWIDFGEGRIMHMGQSVPLGTDGYSVLFATGNLGDGEYVGVSNIDRALKDRLHMIVKLDHPTFRPLESDLYKLFRTKKEPRLSMDQSKNGIKDEIIALHKEFLQREVHPVLPLLGVHFSEGLDYLTNVKGHSKMACDTRWPNLDGIDTNTDEDKIFAVSPRGVFAAMGLASALKMISEARGQNPDEVKLFLDSLRLTLPYSGVLAPNYIDQIHNGDVYSAFDELLGEGSVNRREILDKSSKLEEAVVLAEAGIKNDKLLKEIAPSTSRWSAMKRAVENYAEEVAKNPDEKSKKLKEIILGAHGG